MFNVLSGGIRIRVVHFPLGGYFVWVKLPNNIYERDLINLCAEKAAPDLTYGVFFSPDEARENNFRDGAT